MKITALLDKLDKLPDWTDFIVKRSIEGFRRLNFKRANPDIERILNEVMGDVYDWFSPDLRAKLAVPTPNAL